jgi:hypothetical protein
VALTGGVSERRFVAPDADFRSSNVAERAGSAAARRSLLHQPRRACCATIFSYLSLIVVGSVAYDGVETPHGKVDRMLGGAATYIALSAAYFTPVKIVAVESRTSSVR